MLLFSPAKVNLYFHVLGKRSDGFHEIASLYQAIDLGDKLTIKRARKKDVLYCKDPNVPTDKTNLVLRAAHLFREKTGIDEYFSFSLEKKIPVEAGLGGGSSNAATTLWGLNYLLKTNIADATLATWGGELGADVAFFLSHGRAYCKGYGERLTLLAEDVKETLWIAKPNCQLSTAKVFQNLSLKNLHTQDHYRNDLEVSAFKLLPSLKVLKENLISLGFDKVLMTGSGTAFYCKGDIDAPSLADTQFYKVSFLRRDPKGWYKFP